MMMKNSTTAEKINPTRGNVTIR